MINLYLLLAGIGLILPYYFFIGFVSAYGLDIQMFVNFLLANPISIFLLWI